MGHGTRTIDLYDIARFFSRVKVGAQNICWNYKGKKGPFGYGNFTHNKQKIGAHRFSYILFHGPIGDNLVIRHRCDNPACVNPHHLESGTQLDNIMDRVLRGRSARGAQNGRTTITELEVLAIVRDPRSARLVGLDYGVSGSTVLNIKRGKSWGSVTGIEFFPTRRSK